MRTRKGKSGKFSEGEWRDWFREIVRQHRDGVQEFSLEARFYIAVPNTCTLTDGRSCVNIMDCSKSPFGKSVCAGVLFGAWL